MTAKEELFDMLDEADGAAALSAVATLDIAAFAAHMEVKHNVGEPMVRCHAHDMLHLVRLVREVVPAG